MAKLPGYHCYLILVICDLSPPPFPQCPLCCVRSWRAMFMYLLVAAWPPWIYQYWFSFSPGAAARLLSFKFLRLFSPPRRDPYDYPTHSRPVPRELGPLPGQYSDPPASSRMPIPQPAGQPNNQRYRPSSPSAGRQQRPPLRQDVPPTSTMGYRGRQYYEPAGRQLEGYRQASPGRYASPDRYAYSDDNQSDSRRKNPMIGAV